MHWGPKSLPLQGAADQGAHHLLPLEHRLGILQAEGAALRLQGRVAVQGEAAACSAVGETLGSARLLEDPSWLPSCHASPVMPLNTCSSLGRWLKLQELVRTGTAPAGEGVPVPGVVGGGQGSVLVVRRLVVVVELGEADEEEGDAAEGEDEGGGHHQL